MLKYTQEEFKKMILHALEDFPEHVREHLKNVMVCVEDKPTAEQLEETGMRRDDILLGLFEGVPETEWGKGFGNILPDKITIFRKNIEQFADTPEEIQEEIRLCVWHETAHYFGFDDEEIEKLEQQRATRQQ